MTKEFDNNFGEFRDIVKVAVKCTKMDFESTKELGFDVDFNENTAIAKMLEHILNQYQMKRIKEKIN